MTTSTRDFVDTTYEAHDLSGKHVGYHLRKELHDGKTFIWTGLSENSKLGIPVSDLSLYKFLKEPQPYVIIAEGEKAVDALVESGFVSVGTQGGAHSTPCDDALSTIAQCDQVYLWPDNDKAGLDHMARIAMALHRLGATEISVINWPDAPGKADAFEAVESNVDIHKLMVDAEPFSPSVASEIVVEKTPGGYTSTLLEGGREVKATFNRITGANKIQCEVMITLNGVPTSPPTEYKLNGSVSSRTTFLSDLNKRFPQREHYINWSKFMTDSVLEILERYRTLNPPISLKDVEIVESEARWRLKPFILDNQVTVFYGDGATGKSYLMLWLCLLLENRVIDSRHGSLTLNQDPSEKIMWVDYETEASSVALRSQNILKGFDLPGASNILYQHMSGGSLAGDADRLKEEVERHNVTLVIVDSLGMATNGDLNEAAEVVPFFNALRSICPTAVVISHSNKTGEYFGSSFIHREARSMWQIQKADQNVPGVLELGLWNLKANDTELIPPKALRLKFEDNGAVKFEDFPAIESELVAPRLPVRTLIREVLLQDKREGHHRVSVEMITMGVARIKKVATEKVQPAVNDSITRMIASGDLLRNPGDQTISLPSLPPPDIEPPTKDSEVPL